MTEEEIKKEVDRIIEIKGDFEAAHSEEDDLHMTLIREYCPKHIVDEIERLNDADFPRYCA